MLEETTSLDYVMEKASGPHFFDLRSLIAIAAVSAFTDTNAHHQSFVIVSNDIFCLQWTTSTASSVARRISACCCSSISCALSSSNDRDSTSSTRTCLLDRLLVVFLGLETFRGEPLPTDKFFPATFSLVKYAEFPVEGSFPPRQKS
ncbi:hypothetical protein V6N13_022973 [Hibiscus sabdariffa]